MTAVFGIDAHDAEELIRREVLCVNKTCEGIALNTFLSIKAGDIVFIKKFKPQTGLQVKAVGVVLSGYHEETAAEVCVLVEWLWRGEAYIEEFDEECSRCADLFYEEYNITVQRKIIDLMPDKLQLPKEW